MRLKPLMEQRERSAERGQLNHPICSKAENVVIDSPQLLLRKRQCHVPLGSAPDSSIEGWMYLQPQR